MNPMPKNKPTRLKGKKLQDLFKSVVRRDVECQNPFCSSGFPLEIPHHIKFKSQGGSDIAENLTLTCCECHRMIHHTAHLKVTGTAPDNLIWNLK